MDKTGSCLWRERFPDEQSILDLRKKIGDEVAWQREYLLNIISSEEQIIKKEWILYYDVLPDSNFHSTYYIGVDLAISQEDTADYTAIVPVFVDTISKNFSIYVIPKIINKRLSFNETLITIRTVSNCYPNHAKIHIEDNGYQKATVQTLRSQGFNVEGVTSHIGKFEKLNLTSFLFESGRIFFPRKGAEDLINQILGFGKERHDDLVDALTISLLKICERNSSRTIGITQKADLL